MILAEGTRAWKAAIVALRPCVERGLKVDGSSFGTARKTISTSIVELVDSSASVPTHRPSRA
jgi:hypothetical protein